MRVTTIGAAAALLLASVAPGVAQAQAPMMLGDWSGFYIGGNVGGASGSSTVSGGGFSTPSFNLHGPFGGGTLGFNWQVNPAWVIGLEGDIDATGIGGTSGPSGIGGFFVGGIHVSNSWQGTVRGRIGWLPSPNAMLFVTGGGAFGDINGTGGAPVVHISDTNAGWTVGGGLEYMFAPQWSVKVEYRHVDLGSVNGTCPAVTCGVATGVKATFSDDAGLLGFNYHFNAPPPPPPAPAAMPAPPPAAPKVFIVFFDWDKDVVTPEGEQIIQQAADAYKAGAPVQLQVTGYTDRSGSPGYNQRLSERRANNVAKALAALGVPQSQMVVSGRGENDNRVPTAPGVREPQNRRVEIVAP
jgi:OmpA-OmpF porin, OOP family